MGGANVLTPRNIKDLKMAELDNNPEVEDRYIYIRKAFEGLSDEDTITVLKRIYLDFIKPTMGLDIMNFFEKLALESTDYLLKHKDERCSFQDSLEELKKLRRQLGE